MPRRTAPGGGDTHVLHLARTGDATCITILVRHPPGFHADDPAAITFDVGGRQPTSAWKGARPASFQHLGA